MANGGFICCEYCTYNRSPYGECDIFGIRTCPNIICRAFRMPKESHAQARNRFTFLEKLKPGIVYEIENSPLSDGKPTPAYAVKRITGKK